MKNRMIIRYEELRSNTNEILKQLYKFIDVPIDDNKISEITNNNTFLEDEPPNAWKKRINEKEKQTIEKMFEVSNRIYLIPTSRFDINNQ